MEKLKEKILSANIEEHKKEAKYYDVIHTELFNYYEQKRINKSLDIIINNLDKDYKILDVGCGTGNLAMKLLERDFKNITCLDISNEMIQELKKKVKKYDRNITFIVSDLDTFFLRKNNSKFDIILMGYVLHHLPDYISSLKHLKETLSENGCIYITHESLPLQKPSILANFLLKLDFLMYAIRYIILIAFGKLKYLKRDCRYSDYHTGKDAINLLGVKKIFDNNYDIIINKYSTAKFGFTALLLNKLGFFNNFELIVSGSEVSVNDQKGKIKEYFDKSSSTKNVLYKKDLILGYEQDMRQKAVLDLLDAKSTEIILDVGCGNARDILLVANKCKYVYGIDFSGGMIKEGVKDIKQNNLRNVSLIVGDATNLPFKDCTVDKISCSEVIEHIPNWEDSIKEMSRCLKNNGRLVITTPNKRSIYKITDSIRNLIIKLLSRSAHPYDEWKTQDELIKILHQNNIEVDKKIGVCYLPGHAARVLPNILKRAVTKIIYEIEKRIRYKVTDKGYNLAISGMKYSK